MTTSHSGSGVPEPKGVHFCTEARIRRKPVTAIRARDRILLQGWLGSDFLLLRGRWQYSIQAQIHRGLSIVVRPTAGQDHADKGARKLFPAEEFGDLSQF